MSPMSVQPTRQAPLLPPGTYIEEWLEDHEPMTQKELAARLGTSPKHLNRLIGGYVPISVDMASKLAMVTGYPAEFWLTHQARYDARLAEVQVTEDDVATVKSILPGHCVSRLREAGIVKNTWRRPQDLVRELYARGQVACAAGFRTLCEGSGAVAYRQGSAYEVKSGAEWTWFELVDEQLATVEDVPPFDVDVLRSLIPSLRALSLEDPSSFVPSVTKMLRSAGVIFIAEPDVSGARMSGASFEHEGSPVIAVTDKQKREDVFWFTLFHEIAHVIHEDYKMGAVDREETGTPKSAIEAKADEWAANALLPDAYLESMSQSYSIASVKALASEYSVSPAIVVGRLQHQRILPHSWGNDVIRRFAI